MGIAGFVPRYRGGGAVAIQPRKMARRPERHLLKSSQEILNLKKIFHVSVTDHETSSQLQSLLFGLGIHRLFLRLLHLPAPMSKSGKLCLGMSQLNAGRSPTTQLRASSMVVFCRRRESHCARVEPANDQISPQNNRHTRPGISPVCRSMDILTRAWCPARPGNCKDTLRDGYRSQHAERFRSSCRLFRQNCALFQFLKHWRDLGASRELHRSCNRFTPRHFAAGRSSNRPVA
jgi:hypothetical protein